MSLHNKIVIQSIIKGSNSLEKVLYEIMKSFDFIDIIVISCGFKDFVKYIKDSQFLKNHKS